ncbi:MAG TPA: hypothetical protein VHK91_04560 [Flavisolibacter sp.]|jgi:hypothetical protein|nr:hypothetical protein [Flavisolibacter sp.]
MNPNSKEPFYSRCVGALLVVLLINIALMALIFLLPVFITVTRPGQFTNDDLYQIYRSTTCVACWWRSVS